MPLIGFILSSLLFFSAPADHPENNAVFISPVRIPLALSANFGELRIDHFHSGLDIKTQGEAGKEVVAAAAGYVYRISVSPGGFGKALYLRHPSGFSTVYAHLDRFIPEIEEYVVNQQYAKNSYLVTLFPPREKFPVKQGELIAYSGNSGSSSGPHLHYEIRKSESEKPVNPLLFDFGAGDNIEPVIEKLFVYPVNRHTLINNLNKVKRIDAAGGHGNYYVPAENEIKISGTAGFGIKSYDLLNDSYNRCAVYSIELRIDSTTIFRYVMDNFSFSESRYINSHVDYETYIKENMYIERTYLLPNDRLSVYKDIINNGIYNFNDNKIHHADIIVGDLHGNKSSISFKVLPGSSVQSAPAVHPDSNLKVMPYNKTNRYITDDIYIAIPSGALYDTIYFSYSKKQGNGGMLSDLHYVHNKYTPVHKAYNLAIKPAVIPAGNESKLLIIQTDGNSKKSPVSSKFEDGYVTAEPLSFGMFYVGIDTIAPVISSNGLTPGADLRGRKEMRIRIRDDLSGIGSYEPVIDGKWALFEYDQKNEVLIYNFTHKRLKEGTKHTLALKVADNKGNKSEYRCDFLW
ncbi:MAG: M23 family metallopeptidase [Bacteroidales bacterium]|nr:M23 family metallopeptidase [Bacteroidales bacterium]